MKSAQAVMDGILRVWFMVGLQLVFSGKLISIDLGMRHKMRHKRCTCRKER